MNGNLVLGFVVALVWPAVVVVLAIIFKTTINDLVSRMKGGEVTTPVGAVKLEFDSAAKEVAAKASQAGLASAQISSAQLYTSAGQSRLAVIEEGTHVSVEPLVISAQVKAKAHDLFDQVRAVAAMDPAAAVRQAWAILSNVAESEVPLQIRIVGTSLVRRKITVLDVLPSLVAAGLDSDFLYVAAELQRLRFDLDKTYSPDLTTEGALAYINAAERLTAAMWQFQEMQRADTNEKSDETSDAERFEDGGPESRP